MSRIGKKPISIPKGVKVAIDKHTVTIEGSKGKLQLDIPEVIKLSLKDNTLVFSRSNESKKSKSLHGLIRSLTFNMVEGVEKGFVKELEIVGVGFRAEAKGKMLNLQLGFSHPVNFPIPEGIKIQTPKQNQIKVEGIDKAQVGQTAACIRGILPPEPYQGKGIRYAGEYVRRKVGKVVSK